MKHFFLLGSAPELAAAELEAVVGKTLSRPLPNLAELDFPAEDVTKIGARLGGTVKILEAIEGDFSGLDAVPDPFSELLVDLVAPEKSVQFGISLIGAVPPKPQSLLMDLTKKIKESLSENGRKSRFVLPKAPSTELSSVVVSKQKINELVCAFLPTGKILIGRTVWVQDFVDWGKRDYGRPEAEGHIGMLPPKVARMMVNLALRDKKADEKTLLDPFCGVGTVLAEAMVMGLSVIGSDSKNDQIKRSEKNLAWLKTEYGLKQTFSLQHKTSETVSQALKPASVDLIVTEPDLGPSNENFLRSNLAMTNLKLTALYERSLADWLKILKKDGVVVMVLPSFYSFGNINDECVKKTIDKAKVMGYSLAAGPYSYFRPQAIVRRNICLFRPETSNPETSN